MAATASARRLYLFLGGTFLAGGGLIAAACTTDNGTATNVPTVNDSGRDTGNGSSSGGSSGGSSGSPSDAGADCANIPKPKSSDGPFCFGAGAGAGDSGADASPNKNCDSTASEICCSGGRLPNDAGFAPSECRVAADDGVGYDQSENTCDGITPVKRYECMERAHCPGGNAAVCCVTVSEAGAPKPGQDNDFPGCPVYFQSGRFTEGTRCRDACEAGELQMCSSDAECKAGKCVPITLEGRYGGYCRL